MKKLTSELSGAALDWAVARCKKLGVIDWVEALQVMWYNGRDYWEEGGGYLRQIRNTEGGFEWLLNQRR